jgi:hypothetical protein
MQTNRVCDFDLGDLRDARGDFGFSRVSSLARGILKVVSKFDRGEQTG